MGLRLVTRLSKDIVARFEERLSTLEEKHRKLRDDVGFEGWYIGDHPSGLHKRISELEAAVFELCGGSCQYCSGNGVPHRVVAWKAREKKK